MYNYPSVCFQVEKIIDVVTVEGSIKNFKVQWAPTWVSSLSLVGCEKLIKEYLSKRCDNFKCLDGSFTFPVNFSIDQHNENTSSHADLRKEASPDSRNSHEEDRSNSFQNVFDQKKEKDKEVEMANALEEHVSKKIFVEADFTSVNKDDELSTDVIGSDNVSLLHIEAVTGVSNIEDTDHAVDCMESDVSSLVYEKNLHDDVEELEDISTVNVAESVLKNNILEKLLPTSTVDTGDVFVSTTLDSVEEIELKNDVAIPDEDSQKLLEEQRFLTVDIDSHQAITENPVENTVPPTFLHHSVFKDKMPNVTETPMLFTEKLVDEKEPNSFNSNVSQSKSTGLLYEDNLEKAKDEMSSSADYTPMTFTENHFDEKEPDSFNSFQSHSQSTSLIYEENSAKATDETDSSADNTSMTFTENPLDEKNPDSFDSVQSHSQSPSLNYEENPAKATDETGSPVDSTSMPFTENRFNEIEPDSFDSRSPSLIYEDNLAIVETGSPADYTSIKEKGASQKQVVEFTKDGVESNSKALEEQVLVLDAILDRNEEILAGPPQDILSSSGEVGGIVQIVDLQENLVNLSSTGSEDFSVEQTLPIGPEKTEVYIIENDKPNIKDDFRKQGNPNFEWILTDFPVEDIHPPDSSSTDGHKQTHVEKEEHLKSATDDDFVNDNDKSSLDSETEEIIIVQPEEPSKSKKKQKTRSTQMRNTCETCGKVLSSAKKLNRHINEAHRVRKKIRNREVSYLKATESVESCNVIIEKLSSNSNEKPVRKRAIETVSSESECSASRNNREESEKDNFDIGLSKKRVKVTPQRKEYSIRKRSLPNDNTDVESNEEDQRNYQSKTSDSTGLVQPNDGKNSPIEGKYKCVACSANFINARLFSKHQCFICTYCKEICYDKSLFDKHVEGHKSEKTNASLNCKDCGLSFVYKASFDKHECFCCVHCKRIFLKKPLFSAHVKKHKSDKSGSEIGKNSNTCKDCGLSFDQKHHLDSHTCFTCKFCSKSFMVKSLLDEHVLQHAKAKYKSNLEEAGRGSASSDTSQESDKDDKKGLSCNICKKVFRRRYDVKRHVTKVHNVVYSTTS